MSKQSLFVLFLMFFGSTLKPQHVTTEAIKQIWEKRAEEWSNYVGDNGQNDINRVFQSDPVLWNMLGDVQGLAVLDVGCGEGYLTRQLFAKGAHVIGVDVASNLIAIAQQKAQENACCIDYRTENCADMQSIPSESIDRIVSNYVLMDMPELEKTIAEFYRVLKPTGKVVAVLSHPCFPMETVSVSPDLVLYGWKQPYFKEHVMKLPQWDGFSDGFTIFHRPLSTYWKIFKTAGFEVVEFAEPYLSDDAIQQLDPEVIKYYPFVPHSVAFLLHKR